MKLVTALFFTTILGITVVNAQTKKPADKKAKQSSAQQGSKPKENVKPSETSPKKLTPDEKATKVSDRLEKELNLTAEQKSKIYAIAKARATEVDAVREKYKGDQKAAQPEIKAIREKYKAQMQEVLTPEQKAKLAENKKKKEEDIRQKNKEKDPNSKTPATTEPVEVDELED